MKNKDYKLNIIFIVLGVISLITLTIFTAIFFSLRNIGEDELGLTVKTVATMTAIYIMEDVEEYEAFLLNKDVNSPYYKKMQAYLSDIKKAGNLNFLYTLERIGDGKVIYALDAEPINSENYSAPGTEEDEKTTEEYIRSFNGKLPVVLKNTSYANWGNLITSYAGIYNDYGEIIGIVGADIDAERFIGYYTQFFIAMIIVFIVLFSVIVFVLLKILPRIIEPLIKDKMTGAYSKRYFEEHFKKELENIIKNSGLVTIMMLDLDHFKKVNDTYGHPFGDIVLANIASLITKSLRSNDSLIRYGGEEFVVILTRTQIKNAFIIAERIRKCIEKTPIFNQEKNKDVNITISIGIADSQTCSNIDELINNADKALYSAKKNRNEVYVFKK